MNESLHIGPKGAALIQSFESLQLKAYVDTHEKNGDPRYAIGYGHTWVAGPPHVNKDDEITEAQADEIFKSDMIVFENKIRRYVTVPLNQNQFDALMSAAFNLNTAHFLEMLDKSGLNNGHYAGVAPALMEFDVSQGRKLRGLTRRRAEEGALFDSPVESPT